MYVWLSNVMSHNTYDLRRLRTAIFGKHNINVRAVLFYRIEYWTFKRYSLYIHPKSFPQLVDRGPEKPMRQGPRLRVSALAYKHRKNYTLDNFYRPSRNENPLTRVSFTRPPPLIITFWGHFKMI